jgi:hypothetical protein
METLISMEDFSSFSDGRNGGKKVKMEADISHIPFALDVVDAAPSGMVSGFRRSPVSTQRSAISRTCGKLHAED